MSKADVIEIEGVVVEKLTLEMSPYDLSKGRIIWRDK